MDKTSSFRNEILKANRASETEGTEEGKAEDKTQKKIEQEGEQNKTTKGKGKVVRNRRPRETAPDHSQKIEAR